MEWGRAWSVLGRRNSVRSFIFDCGGVGYGRRESGSFLRFCGVVEESDSVRLCIFVCGAVGEGGREFGSFLHFCVARAAGEVFA